MGCEIRILWQDMKFPDVWLENDFTLVLLEDSKVYWLFFLSALNTCKDFIECTPQELWSLTSIQNRLFRYGCWERVTSLYLLLICCHARRVSICSVVICQTQRGYWFVFWKCGKSGCLCLWIIKQQCCWTIGVLIIVSESCWSQVDFSFYHD